jgi:hypothetical protein
MKQIISFSFFCVFVFGCKENSKQSETKTDSTISKEKYSYPFTPKYSINWQPGDEKNALIVLDCLKKYVDGDIKGCLSFFADTSKFIADKFYFKGNRDSLVIVIASMRNASAAVSKNFDSWMTVYYPDKNETWVTLWYMEKMTDKKGKQDSIYYTDDVLVKNGKIVEYHENQRLFPGPHKK